MAFPRSFLCPLAVIAPVVLFTNGCASHYVPITPRAPESAGGVRAHVDRLYLNPGGRRSAPSVTVGLLIDEALAESHLLDAAITPISEAPCARVEDANVVSLRANPQSLDAGTRILVYARAPWERVTEVASRVDLLVENGDKRACLALDVTSPGPEHAWRYAGATTLGISIGGAGYTRAVNGSDATAHFGWLVGRWLGPLRLSVGTALAVDECSATVCPRGKNGTKAATLDLPLYVHADYYFAEGRDIALGMGARYAFVATDQFREGGGNHWTTNHGLGLAPLVAWTATNPVGNGVVGGTHVGTLDFETPIGIVTPLDDYTHPALSIGLAVTLTGGF